MTRQQFNREYGQHREPTDIVQCHVIGPEPREREYDPKCSRCWLGHRHTWEEHDKKLGS